MRNYPDRRHSSFNTTFNVLENLHIAAGRGLVPEPAFREAERRAVELLLAHRLYRSDKTGEVIAERFTHLTYPWHWHYKVEMEKPGGESRWNTLRALRVLRRRESSLG